MGMKPRKWTRSVSEFSSILILTTVSTVHAEDSIATTSPQVVAQVTNSTSTIIPDQGYRIHASLGGGFGTLAGGQYQSSPSGSYYLGSVGIGRRTRRWEWDTNLGWGYSNRSGTDISGNPVNIRIRSARSDLSARFRLTKFFSVGPVLTANFGTDTQFDTNIKTGGATFYGGAKATLDIGNAGSLPMQAWGEALTEVSSFGRDAFTLLAGIRISLPIQEKQTDVVTLSQAAPRQDVRVVIDARKIFFKTDSSKIRPEMKQALSEISKYLAEANTNWENIEISGHADTRGPEHYNVALSQRRANSVKKALITAGIDENRVRLEAFGYSKPVDSANTPSAWKKNRRVELTFKNVLNPEKLEQLLEPMELETRTIQ